ncbi:MAG: annexin [Firmicutes bacterium]|nr:annexin [Bacillota bacterium]
MDSVRGQQIGTWEGMTRLTNSKLTAGDQVGGRYKTMDDAVKAAYDHKGAEAILKNKEGDFSVYGIKNGSSSDLTKGNIEQVKDYPVSNVTTKGTNVKGLQAIVTEDSHVFNSPEVHGNRNSGNSFVINDRYEKQPLTASQASDRLYYAMKGVGTDEEGIFKAFSKTKPEERPAIEGKYQEKYGSSLKKDLDNELGNVTGDRKLAAQMMKNDKPIIDQDKLLSDIDNVNNQYKAKGGKLKDSSGERNGALLIAHLSTPGDGFSSQGVPASNETGKEFKLYQAIQKESQTSGKKLNPADVYRLSLELNEGDKFNAMLTAHNTLRAAARGGDSYLGTQADRKEFKYGTYGASSDHEFMKNNLQSISGGNDETGGWYHMFGTATAAMKTGSMASKGMSMFESYLVSRDQWTDPMESRLDEIGIAMGKRVANAR